MGGPPGWTACGEVGSGRFPGDEAGFRARVADAAAAAVCLLVASAPLRCGVTQRREALRLWRKR